MVLDLIVSAFPLYFKNRAKQCAVAGEIYANTDFDVSLSGPSEKWFTGERGKARLTLFESVLNNELNKLTIEFET